MLTVRKRRLATRLFREALGAVAVLVDGVTIHVQAGDLIDAELIRVLPDRGAGLLGKTVTPSQAEALVGHPIPESQFVVRLGESVSEIPAPVPVESDGAPIVRLSDDPEDLELPEGVEDTGVVFVDEDVVIPIEEWKFSAILREAAESSGADLVFPAHNLAEPCSLPMNGDSGSPLKRLPGGLSTWEIAKALSGRNFQPVDAHPERPGCVYLSPAAVQASLSDDGLVDPKKATTARAFVWREADTEGPVADLAGGAGRAGPWATVAASAGSVARLGAENRPPVAFYSTAVGPWGGVGVLFRLCDELQRLGIHAHVVYASDVPHKFRPQTAPLKIPNDSIMERDWHRLVGEEAVLVASHWGSGHKVVGIKKAHPDVVLTSILQDREDLFVSPNGRSMSRDVVDAYLSIESGASVSKWILDTAELDLGLRRARYRVINAGVDMDTFRDRGLRDPDSPVVRVLAMWRPQTNDRRGGALLHEVYAKLAKLKTDRADLSVSLEVFGFSDPKSPPPAGVKHHGILSPAEVAALMSEVDIVIEPSQYQGFGLPAVEAAACGACVVSTTNLGIDEWAIHGENAFVVPHKELPEAACYMVANSSLRRTLARAGNEAVQKFDWPIIGHQWADFLAELYLAQHPNGRWSQHWSEIRSRLE